MAAERGIAAAELHMNTVYSGTTAGVEAPTLPLAEPDEQSETKELWDQGYLVICWNDPVNLMDYVTHVFQRVFGWSRQKAERHMLQVHHEGKSILAKEPMEKAEHYVHQLHSYHLHATMEPG